MTTRGVLSTNISRLAWTLPHNQAVTGVALDLSKVELITSAAIGALITVHKKMAASGQKFVLFNLSSMLSQALSFLQRSERAF